MFDSIIQHQSGIDPTTTDLRPLPVLNISHADIFCVGCGAYIDTATPAALPEPINDCPTESCVGPTTALSTVVRPHRPNQTSDEQTIHTTEARTILGTYWNYLLRRGVSRDDPEIGTPFGGDTTWEDVLPDHPWHKNWDWITHHLGQHFVAEARRFFWEWDPYNPLFHPEKPRCPIRGTVVDPEDVQMHHWSRDVDDPDHTPPSEWDRVTPLCDPCHEAISMGLSYEDQRKLAQQRQLNKSDWDKIVAPNLIRRYSLHQERPVTPELCRKIQQQFNVTLDVSQLLEEYEREHPECDGGHELDGVEDVVEGDSDTSEILIMCDECGCRAVEPSVLDEHHPELTDRLREPTPGMEEMVDNTDWDDWHDRDDW